MTRKKIGVATATCLCTCWALASLFADQPAKPGGSPNSCTIGPRIQNKAIPSQNFQNVTIARIPGNAGVRSGVDASRMRRMRQIPPGDLAMPNGGSNCCFANGGLGCDNAPCQNCVCGIDPFCCGAFGGNWDGLCAGEAIDECCAVCPCGGC